jgi:hypothetical protein
MTGSDPVIRDARLFESSHSGWSLQLGRYRLAFTILHGGWSVSLHRLIRRSEP